MRHFLPNHSHLHKLIEFGFMPILLNSTALQVNQARLEFSFVGDECHVSS